MMEGKCVCDCGCSKPDDRLDSQCEDCDNGIHWNEVLGKYVNYDEDGQSC